MVCAAARQANQRAQAADLSAGELKVLLNIVLEVTAGYSRLADRVSVAQLTPVGMSQQTARRAVRKLAKLEIIHYLPGSGRGKLSVVGLPRAEKGVQPDVHLSIEKGGHLDVHLRAGKGGHGGTEKVDTHARVHAGAIPSQGSEKKATEETTAPYGPPAGGTEKGLVSECADAFVAATGTGLSTPASRRAAERSFREIVAAGGTPGQVHDCAALARETWDYGYDVTPKALARQWHLLITKVREREIAESLDLCDDEEGMF